MHISNSRYKYYLFSSCQSGQMFYSCLVEMQVTAIVSLKKNKNRIAHPASDQALRLFVCLISEIRGTTTGPPRTFSRAKFILNGLPKSACMQNVPSFKYKWVDN